MRKVTVAVTGLMLVAACQQAPINGGSFAEWVEDTAAVLDDWPEVDPDDLDILDECVDRAQVVMLGEPDHYVAEKYDYRLTVVRYLVARGFRWIGMEMGYSDGLRVDDYLETGDEKQLHKVALYGYRGDARSDRDDIPWAFAALTDAPFLDSFIEAETSFLRTLRALSDPQSDRLHWFGFDVDPFPGGGYADVEALLRPYESDPVVADLSARLARVPGESREEEAERLEGLEQYLGAQEPSLEAFLGADQLAEFHRVVRNLIESLRFRDLAYQEPFGSRWMEGLQYRETAITERLDTGWPPPDGAKVILMGHNFHLSKSGVELRSGSVAEAGPTMGYPSFGSGVADRMDTCTIWMLYDHGTSADALAADPYFEVSGDPERIEHLLAGVAPALIVDLSDDDRRATWLDTDANFVSNGAPASGPVRRQADVLFFVEEVHAVGTAP